MIAALVLAAGGSTRMGRQKMLLPWRGESLVRRAAREALSSRVDRVIVVVGSDAAAVRAALAGLPVTVIENPDWAGGMSTSIRAGLRAVPDAGAVVILLADQPGVTAAAIDALIEAWARGAPLAAAEFQGTTGPPALFDRRFFPELERLADDAGARGVLRAHAGVVAAVPVPEAALDLDTPDDLARASNPEA